MSRIRRARLGPLLVCFSIWLVTATAALAQPSSDAPPRAAAPPNVAQILSDGGWRSLTWYLLTRDDREEVFVRDVGLDPHTAAVLAEYGSRAAGEYAAHRAKLKAEYCPRLARVTNGHDLETAMREWTPRGEQELTRLLAGAFDLLSDPDVRRLTRHLGQLSQTALFMGSDFDVDYAALSAAGVERMVGSVCSPDA